MGSVSNNPNNYMHVAARVHSAFSKSEPAESTPREMQDPSTTNASNPANRHDKRISKGAGV